LGLNKYFKKGDRILHITKFYDAILISIEKIERVIDEWSYIGTWIIQPFYLPGSSKTYKNKVFYKYFREDVFISRLSSIFSEPILYKKVSDEDILLVEALVTIPSSKRIWAKIVSLKREEMIDALKPYLLSHKLGRKESGKQFRIC